jgi:putative transposase
MLMGEFDYSERTACNLMGVGRSSYRYEPKPDGNARLRQELIEIAKQKPHYGYRRLQVLLECTRLIRPAVPIAQFQPANEEWSMDFVMDAWPAGARYAY